MFKVMINYACDAAATGLVYGRIRLMIGIFKVIQLFLGFDTKVKRNLNSIDEYFRSTLLQHHYHHHSLAPNYGRVSCMNFVSPF